MRALTCEAGMLDDLMPASLDSGPYTESDDRFMEDVSNCVMQDTLPVLIGRRVLLRRADLDSVIARGGLVDAA